MGKALLYFLLFVGITLLMVGCGTLLAGLIMSQGLYSALGIDKAEVLVYVVMVMGILWTVIICWLFSHYKYGSLSWGIMSLKQHATVLPVSALLFLSVDIVAFWCHHLLMPFSEEYVIKMQLFQSHPFMTLVTLLVMYVTVQVVMLSGVLRQLANAMRHKWIAMIIVAVALSFLNLEEGGLAGLVMFGFAVISGLIECWLYLRTRSIWPSVVGPVVGDYVLWIALSNTPQLWMGVTGIVMIPLLLYLLQHKLLRD